MGSLVPEPAVIEPALLQTRYISGILKPEFDGECWLVSIYEERTTDGVPERVVVERFAISQPNFVRAVTVAASPIGALLGLALPLALAS